MLVSTLWTVLTDLRYLAQLEKLQYAFFIFASKGIRHQSVLEIDKIIENAQPVKLDKDEEPNDHHKTPKLKQYGQIDKKDVNK